MFRDTNRKPRHSGQGSYFYQRSGGARRIEVIRPVLMDLMTGKPEQPSDWPTPDARRPAAKRTAEVLAVAAMACGALGLNIAAPRLGDSPAVMQAPGPEILS